MNQSKQPPSSSAPKPARGQGWLLALKIIVYTFLWLMLFGLLAGLTAAGAVAGYVASLVKDDPVRDRAYIEQKISENSQTGFVYFRDGSLVGQLRTEEDRRPITYEEIPKVVIDSVLAIEDKNFFNHIGIDMMALLRAVKQQVLNESVQTGGSTITQQVARRVFLSLEQTQSRKAKEIFLSLRLERFLTKEEILTAYLNKIPYGNGSSGYNLYGIKAAAKGIFGIDNLHDLNLAQAAYLAGLPQRPSAYSAFTSKGEFNEANFKRALDRQKLVLRRMLEEQMITKEEYEEALAFDIYSSLAKPEEKAYNKYPYLMLEAERQASEILVLLQNPELKREDLRKKEYADLVERAREQLLRGGYHVYTTIDKEVYDLMREIASNPDNFSPDSKTKGVEQIAAIMLDHKTGAILGMIEGRDFHLEQMNYATQMTRQPGSAMKPIAAYLPALEKGLIQPASILDDAPIILDNGAGGKHIPRNATNTYSGLVTARTALNKSLNIPALKVFLEKVTIDEAWKFVQSMGITTLDESDWHAQTGVIGGLKYGVTVEELTNAYGVIANKGVFMDAYLIEEIRITDGTVVYKHEPKPKRIVSEQTAYLMTDMLKTVITNGTATMVRSKFKRFGEIDIAGKTGTTQNYGDVWFQGFTPDITLGVWAGYEKQIHSLTGSGRDRAKLIWAAVMNAVTEAKPELFPNKKFERPDGLVSMTVSSVSGKLPTSLTRAAGRLVTDLFNRQYVPTEMDDALVSVKYITYNGVNYLPHPETPEDMLREAVMIKREKPIDVLIEEIKAALQRVAPKNRRSLESYLPADAANSAPGRTDPRTDDGYPPPAPGQVFAETIGTEVHITFQPVHVEDVAGYRLYRSADGIRYDKVGPSILTDEPAKFIDANPSGIAYSYYVTAVDIAGKESAPSAIVTIDGVPFLPEYPDSEYPGGVFPGGDDPAAGEPGAVFPGGDDPTAGEPGAVFPGGGDPTAGEPGDAANPESAVPPTAPKGLSVQTTNSGIVLTWQENPGEESVTAYHVWFSTSDQGQYTLLGTTSTNRFEHTSPPAGGWYRVTAVNAAGESPYSTSVKAAN